MHKKVLTVMLSAVLSACLMPCAAFANATVSAGYTSISSGMTITQFTDEDQIRNREAVSVLVGLGVIDGMGDGTFQPQGTLTRAQTAKLISVLLGYHGQERLTRNPERIFTDVPDSHWATDYIFFGVSQKYLNGMGDGTFDPEGRVTTAHLATILDKILGYTPEDVNQQWPSRAMDIAETNGLLVNVAKTAGEPLVREEAAQMMLNALEANTKHQTGNQEAGAGSYTYQENRNSAENDYQKRNNNTQEQLVERLFLNVTCRNYSEDDLGHERRVWRNGNGERIAEYPVAPAFTYTSKKTVPELSKDLEGYSLDNAELWLNACIVSPSKGYIRSCSDLAERLTGNGVQTEIYMDYQKKEVTKIITVRYSLRKVIACDSGKETVSLENSSRPTVLTPKMIYFEKISSAVAGDRIFAAPAYHYVNDRNSLRFEQDWADIVDAYLPYQVSGIVTGTRSSSDSQEDPVLFLDETPYSLADGMSAESFRNTSGSKVIAYIDRTGFLAGYETAGQKEIFTNWVFVKELYREVDPFSGSMEWHLTGCTETGTLRDLRINDLGTEESDSLGDPHITAADARANKTFAWFRNYRDMIDSYIITSDPVNPDIILNENRVFLKDGTAVCYQESAAGCFLSEDSRDMNDVLLSYSYGTKENLTGVNNYIAGIRVSDSVRSVCVGGNQRDNLSVTVSTRVENIPAGSVCIIKKTATNSLRITTVFTEKEFYEASTKTTLVRVTSISGTCAYTDASGELRSDGVQVIYYEADSAEQKKMIVASPETGMVQTGWYSKLTTFGEAYILDGYIKDTTTVRWDNTTKTMTGGFYTGTIVSGYNGLISVEGDLLSSLSFQFTGNNAIRDLSGSGIETVDDLVKAVSEGRLTNKVVFSFTTRNEQNIITQLYIN